MPAGLQIINANNIVQIDQDFQSLEYRAKYSGVGTSVSFTTPGYPNEVLAIRAEDAFFFIKSKIGNTWTIEANVSTTISVWLFSAPTLVAGNSGFEIYRADGSLVFDGGKTYMKPVWSGKVSDSAAPGSGADFTASLSAGDYAAVLCGMRRWVSAIDRGSQGIWSSVAWDGVLVSGTGVTVGSRFGTQIPTNPANGFGGTANHTGGWLSIVDVSLLN